MTAAPQFTALNSENCHRVTGCPCALTIKLHLGEIPVYISVFQGISVQIASPVSYKRGARSVCLLQTQYGFLGNVCPHI